MSDGLYLIACAGPSALDRTLLLSGAVAGRGGRVVVLTYTPGLALSRTFFGLEVVVRREEDLVAELFRLESLALSRGAGVLLLDDDRLCDEHAAPLRVLSQHLAVARYGPKLAGGAAGELAIDPYGPHWPYGRYWPEAKKSRLGDALLAAPSPLQMGGCFGLSYLPLHPGLRPLRDRRRTLGPLAVPDEVGKVTILCRETDPEPESDDAEWARTVEGPNERRVPQDLAMRALEALSVWRPTLHITVLCENELSPSQQAGLEQAARLSRHEVTVRPLLPAPSLGEALVCDLAIVDDPDHAAMAAYLGTPVVLLSRTESAVRRSEVLAQSGVAIHLPSQRPEHLQPAMFADVLWTLFADHSRRAQLATTAHRVVDGLGTERIAAALLDLHHTRRRH